MDIDGIACLLKDTAEAVITPRFRQLTDGQIEEKEPGDFVTVADREAELHLANLLKDAHPGAVIVGEEGIFLGSTTLDALTAAPHVFVIDPIDGTRNFVEGKAEHGIMLAEVRHGVTTRGWIWQPQYDRMFTVEGGSGEVLQNGAPMQLGSPQDPPLGAAGSQRFIGFDADGHLRPTVRSSGSAAFDYPMILAGDIDFMVFVNAHPWDHLAGCLMLAETGGVGRMFSGEDYSPATRGKGLLVARSEAVWKTAAEHWRK